MDETARKNKHYDSDQRIRRRHVLISGGIIVFFVAIILLYAAKLYDEMYTHLPEEGRLDAMALADNLEGYLQASIDVINLDAATVEAMIADGCTTEHIHEFLHRQSQVVPKTVFKDTSGLYGFVNGQYLDGLDWQPPDDYDAKNRPWYVQALHNPGRVTLIDPYSDLEHPGRIVMTVAKRLGDTNNVIAMDVWLDALEALVKKSAHEAIPTTADKPTTAKTANDAIPAVAPPANAQAATAQPIAGASDAPASGAAAPNPEPQNAIKRRGLNYAVILDSKHKVVAHSKGKGYFARNYDPQAPDAPIPGETDDVWRDIVGRTKGSDVFVEANGDRWFPYQRNNIDYLVYFRVVENGWMCISVKDAIGIFRPLKWVVFFTILLILGVSVALFFMLEKTHQIVMRANKLGRQLSAIANTYYLLVDIDVPNDTFMVVNSALPQVTAMLASHQSARAMYADATNRFIAAKSKVDMAEFVDMRTLPTRLRDCDTIAHEFLREDGTWSRGRFVASRRDADGGLWHVLWIIEDIDIEKRRRDRLIDMSARAMAASEAKSAFLSNMSHEIRTPINAVLGMNEMILRESDDANVLAYSDSIKTAGNTLLGIINDVLDFSKIESGKMQIIPVDYDLSSVINDLVSMVQSRADAKGLTLNLGFDRELPKWLNGDEVRIKQVITNVLTNAVKYTEKGSVSFSLGFERIKDDPDHVTINVAVQDTGIGIKEEDMKKLFSEFERLDEQRNRHIEGTGLGMSITTSLLGLMGTSLKVHSVYGKGSLFYFAIKQKVVKWEPLGDYHSAYTELLKGRKRYHESFVAPDAVVLMVDDNPMNLMVFKSLLKQTQVRVDLANDGNEGLRLSHDKQYDIIFLDHMMPGKDGIETLHELRSQPNNPNLHTPMICLTANAISGAREQYIHEGFDDYLTKPIDSARLEEMLMEFLPPEKVRRYAPDQAAATPAAGAEAAAKADPALPPALAALAGTPIDVNVGLRNSGSVDAYLPLLKIFSESMDETATAIEGFFETEDLKSYTIKVHALKSSARIIGATAFGEEAQQLEDAGKRGDFAFIRARQAKFMEAYRAFKEPLARALAAEDAATEKPEADPTLMAEAFAEVRAAAEDMDNDRLEGVFKEMEDYQVPAADAELWGRLKEASWRYDYEALTRLLDESGHKA